MLGLAGRRIICGDGAVGKSCLLNRHMNDDFSVDGYQPSFYQGEGFYQGEAELGNYGLQACKVTTAESLVTQETLTLHKSFLMNVDAFMVAFSLNADRFDSSLDNAAANVRRRRRHPFAIASRWWVFCALWLVWHELGLSGGCVTGAAGGLSGFRWPRKPRRRPGCSWWGHKRTGTPWTGPVRVRRLGGR
jgi:hypothetical protein